MFIDRILYPINTLGPGNRIVVWTRGCSKKCHNCANPELWNKASCKNTSVSDVAQIIKNICKENVVDGITFTGGDPLEQFDDMLELLSQIKPIINDILVYTGFEFDDLLLLHPNEINELKQLISVLIDGPYIDENNDSKSALIGSTNQNIMIFDFSLKEAYETYIQQGRKIQNILIDNKFISVGIHNQRGTKYEK